ncbi:MAG: hypothetical protein ACRC4M_02705 [Mycoplasma sp.]
MITKEYINENRVIGLSKNLTEFEIEKIELMRINKWDKIRKFFKK